MRLPAWSCCARATARSAPAWSASAPAGLACHRADGDDWRFYEIDPLVAAVALEARHFDLLAGCAPDSPLIVADAPKNDAGRFATAMAVWVLIARDAARLDALAVGSQWRARPWTEDYSSILAAIRWCGTDFTTR